MRSEHLCLMVALIFIANISMAFTIDGDFADWEGVTAKVEDPQDMADSSGDIKMIQAAYEEDKLFLRMMVYGVICPSVAETPAGMTNRYYYHWILDTDDNVNTGYKNSEYEGNPTNVDPIGVDVVVMLGWRDGNPNGVEVYDPLTEEMFMTDFEYAKSGDSLEAMVPLDVLGLKKGSTISFSAFQEGASDNWAVDWLNPTTVKLEPMAVDAADKLATTWAGIKTH